MQKQPPKSGDTIAVMVTNKGEMRFRLFPELVDNCVKNFVELAKAGKYDGAPFHRIIHGFMIQGGDFTNRNGTGGHSCAGPKTTIGDQYHASLTHIRGALSYAKTAAPNSIGSQFFIVHPEEGTHFLDHPANGGPADGYSVFGQLFEGFETLDAIASVQTRRDDSPVEPITIEKVTIEVFA